MRSRGRVPPGFFCGVHKQGPAFASPPIYFCIGIDCGPIPILCRSWRSAGPCRPKSLFSSAPHTSAVQPRFSAVHSHAVESSSGCAQRLAFDHRQNLTIPNLRSASWVPPVGHHTAASATRGYARSRRRQREGVPCLAGFMRGARRTKDGNHQTLREGGLSDQPTFAAAVVPLLRHDRGACRWAL